MVGRTVSHYEILERLGAGGMGEVYKAEDTRLNRLVAVKVMLGNGPDAGELRRRFVQEAQAASSLNHPNIITVHDIFSEGPDQFMVMEYVKGQTLADILAGGALDASRTLQYAVQVADGLRAAHSAGIVHRDLKPGNVMVSTWGLVKILDFGLAKVCVPTGDVSLSDITQTAIPAPMTVEGSILGTCSYMAPEQAQGGRVDARSDIFSFGCVLYEMLTGRKAFAEKSPLLILTAILRDDPPPVADPEFQRIISRALQKDPAGRYQSMGEMHSDLAAFKQRLDSGIQPRPEIPPPPPPLAPARKPAGLIAAAGIVLLLLASAAGWWWMSRGRPATSPQTAVNAPSGRSGAPKPSALSPPMLNNQAILDMAVNHVPESVILAQIHSSPTNFNLTTPEIIRLTKGGVSEAVIHAMRDPSGTVKPPEPQTRTVQLVGGMPIEIALAEDVPPDCEPGQVLTFRTTTDIAVDGTVVIAKGAPVTGVIVDAAKRKFLAHTRPTYRLLEVTVVNGSKLKVRAVPGRLGDSRKAPPLDPLGGSRSKDAVAPAGSRFIAYVDGDQSLTLPR